MGSAQKNTGILERIIEDIAPLRDYCKQCIAELGEQPFEGKPDSDSQQQDP
jgi:hypothetical protein